MSKSLLRNIVFLWKYLGKHHKLSLVLLSVLMPISMLLEALSLGMIFPFLNILISPEDALNKSWLKPFVDIIGIVTVDNFLVILTIVFISISVLSVSLRIFFLWLSLKLSTKMGIRLRVDIFSRVLKQKYEKHLESNSSELIATVTQKVESAIYSAITQILMLFTSLLLVFTIIVTLFFINPFVSIVAFSVLGGGYILIGFLVRARIKSNGVVIAAHQPQAIKSLQHGLGGIRDVILSKSQYIFITKYEGFSSKIQTAINNNLFLSQLPKPIMEMIAIIFIAFLSFLLMKERGQDISLGLIGVLALGAQRLLPALQQVFFSWSQINSSNKLIQDTVDALKLPVESKAMLINTEHKLCFEKEFSLKSVMFKYSNAKTPSLFDVNISISKGSCIGFVGETGSGKTTLVDVIMGLLDPIHGCLTVDGRAIDKKTLDCWRSMVAHVPQNIFLSDSSIAENIAFGEALSDINLERVMLAADQAHISEYIESLPDAYQTVVGERGARLSGGQRQRIGIARALYIQAEVIIFDEATSALDSETEKRVMKEINSLDENITVIIIAHRVSTLKCCDTIYRLSEGKVVGIASFSELINT